MPTTNIASKPAKPQPLSTYPASALCPARLDRLADFELQQGHHVAAEKLALRAAELRGAA